MSGAAQPPKPPQGGDPAMDDILASIRKILNEDEQMPQGGAAAAPAQAGAAPTGPEPLELTEAMLVQPVSAPVPAPPAVLHDPVPDIPVSEPRPPILAVPQDDDEEEDGQGGLVAPAVAAAATAAVGQLLRAVAQERSATISRGGPSIEDVVREEMRPLLKEWLDQHLPPLVERLVRAEIERVVGRALP